MAEARPEIAHGTSAATLRRWYWTRAELVTEAKRRGLHVSGGKFDILDRIAHHIETGEVIKPARARASSDFDWHSADLSPQTVITDSYRNTQNVRRFFKSQVGDGFKFNIAFMAWMKDATGKTLADAVAEYLRQKADDTPAKIADHNQFNQYTHDYMADNPGASMDDVRAAWASKRRLPSEDGRHSYDPP